MLVFFLFGSMIAAIKYDIRDEEYSYLYKAYREHLQDSKKNLSRMYQNNKPLL